ncbi:MAG: hypothetical protein ACFFAE_08945 [Candidatus Hodarchaeota archaeon]
MTFNPPKKNSKMNPLQKIISVKSKLSIITTTFLMIGILTIGVVFIELNSPPTIKPVSGFRELPLKPYETRSLPFQYSIANGQSVFINISTSNVTALKLSPATFGTNESNFTDPISFDLDNSLVSCNSTNHLFTLPQAKYYTVYRVFLKNLRNQTVTFDGYVKISGFNHDFLLVPFLLLSCYGLIVGCSFLVSRIINLVNKKKHNSKRKGLGTVDNHFISSFSRIKSLWKLQRQEITLFRLIIIILLLWIALQPMVTMNYRKQCFTIQAVLENAENYLITPIKGYGVMLLIAALIVIETSEVITSKIARQDILITLTLPVKRLEWLLSEFSWIFYQYGLTFSIILIIKAFIISLQMRLIYPWLSLIGWFSLFLCSFLAWISTGLLVSSTSSTRVSATIKGLITILIGLMVVHLIGGGHYENFGDYGILNIDGIAYSLWHHYDAPSFLCKDVPDVQIQGIIVQTPPYLNNLFGSVVLMVLWFILSLTILCFVIQKYEIK